MGVYLGSEMKFYVYPYQHKGEPYRAALEESGHIEDNINPDIILIDRDQLANEKLPREEVIKYPNAVVTVYPHSPLPPWWYDGLVQLRDYVKCVFVIGEGQKRAMKIIAPHARVETTGWAWSELRPFQDVGSVKNIFFAPIHPAGGRLRPEAIDANAAITKDLVRLAEHGYDVTIRYMGSRFRQGIRRCDKIKFVQGVADGSTKEIDEADLVIAEGTMMYLSIARGKPTIGINQHLPTRGNKHSDQPPHNWSKYGDGIAYPINYGSAPIEDLMRRAASFECKEWRRDFIGDKLIPQEFAAKVERIWKENERL
jgi:hypothetical protein